MEITLRHFKSLILNIKIREHILSSNEIIFLKKMKNKYKTGNNATYGTFN